MTGRRRAESVPLRAAGSAAPSPARPPPPALAEVAEVAEAPREGSPPGGLPQHEEGARSPAARQNAGEVRTAPRSGRRVAPRRRGRGRAARGAPRHSAPLSPSG